MQFWYKRVYAIHKRKNQGLGVGEPFITLSTCVNPPRVVKCTQVGT